MQIQKTINDKTIAEQESRNVEDRGGLWTPSRFGRCFRFQYWTRSKEEPTNPPDISALKRFKLGNLIHNWVQSQMDCEKEVEVKLEDLIGYADLVDEEYVADIKSVSDWAYKYISRPDCDIKAEKYPNWLQVGCYAVILKRPKTKLFFVNTKDIHKTCEFELETLSLVDDINKELSTLRDYWSAQKLPPAQPRCYGGKECNYCAYMDKCFALEGDKDA